MKRLMLKNKDDLYIEVNSFGFVLLLDKNKKYNLMHPEFLNFFKEDYPLTEEDYQANQEAVEKLLRENKEAFPVLPDHLKQYFFKGVYRDVGSKVVRCSDKKLRRCKAVKFDFKFNGNPYSELFYIDKRLTVPAILGVISYKRITERK